MPQSGACQVENNQDRQGENSHGPLEDNYHLEGSLLLDRDTLEHRVEGKGLGKDQKVHQLAGDPQRRVVVVGMEEALALTVALMCRACSLVEETAEAPV